MNKQIISKKNSIASFFSLVFNTFGAKKKSNNVFIHIRIFKRTRIAEYLKNL